MAERDFKGIWIPAEVWLDERLNPLEKVILMEIDSLDCGENGCYASNEYIAGFCQCSESKVAHAVTRLVEFGYVSRKSFDGRQRILQSRLAKFARQTCKVCKADVQSLQESNIDSNKDINSSIKKEYKESPQDSDFTVAVVDYLNEKAGTHYRAGVAKTQSLIKARASEGFTEADFRTVIDKKCADWIGTEYEQYLRPQTLFGTKFESYLNGMPYNNSKYQAQKKRSANVPDWVPDEVVNQPDFKCMDTMLNYPSYGIVTYVTTAGQYGTWEPETKERADKIQCDYNEWLKLKKKGGVK
nr:MAG TPA: hypothetical protein [Caudoviricetes sp.]